MKTNIQSIHFDASEQLQAFIEKKTAKHHLDDAARKLAKSA